MSPLHISCDTVLLAINCAKSCENLGNHYKKIIILCVRRTISTLLKPTKMGKSGILKHSNAFAQAEALCTKYFDTARNPWKLNAIPHNATTM